MSMRFFLFDMMMSNTFLALAIRILQRYNIIILCKTHVYLKLGLLAILAGLCSRDAWVKQATNFYLWATGKTYFFSYYMLKCWAPRIS